MHVSLAILRSYRTRAFTAVVSELLESKRVERIVVVTAAALDAGATEGIVAAEFHGAPVAVLPLTNYGWAKALNAGLGRLEDPGGFVLTVSNEVALGGAGGIGDLLSAAATPNSSCGFSLFEGRAEASYRVPRNTLAIWRGGVFHDVGRFDEGLDEVGMEDYDLALRAHRQLGLLPFASPRAAALAVRDPLGLPAKIQREALAMERIEARGPSVALRTHLHREVERVLLAQAL